MMEEALSLQSLINIGFSLFGLLLSILVTAIFKRINEVSSTQEKLWEKHNELAVDIPQNYVAKNDFRYMIDSLIAKLDRIDNKLDKQIEKEAERKREG